ncbi:HlyD family efflux transporter periplasmic adaptor subunit [Bacillus sp. ISL-41]|uniref:efflux RND transporter periplasmic adaptor subunit n=1 Tax=Bacillus sp. ISL-41 TaxID=2819127 RepID=UPI001BE8C003|nr:HlyD family efflux transporter periplasmic adaptor subunit [Bacillus sp. ISL-41]MBT2642971.1 HlyD family efflux transporter periplasmic adaptor subunit [Bacillus sp. ISL-41]
MKKKSLILMSAGILFISGNLYLALKDDSKAVRSSYINKWTATGKESLTKTLQAEGVVTPVEEHHVYYNDTPGGFKNFLVKEGDPVDVGSPLYEYAGDSNEAEREKLEMEKQQLVREVALIDEQIQQLEYLLSVSESATDNSIPVTGDGTSDTGRSSSELMNVSIEKEIYDKKSEKTRISAEIDEYDNTLNSQDSGDQLGINSEVAGTVKKINYDLNNPILTIISDSPKVEGTFTEKDLKEVQEGMEVFVKSDLVKGNVKGTLTSIASYPEQDPSVKTESRFPYEVELTDEQAVLIKGTHVEVAVVTDQVVNAATVPEEAVVKTKKASFVYVLNELGIVEKRKITKGLELDGNVEVKKGAKPGELVVKNPEAIQKAGDPFFSKLKPGILNKKTFSKEPGKEIFKSIMVGFFKR